MTEVHLIRYKTDTCYIVNSGDKAILVDTSSGEGYETVLAECSKYNIQLILLTHVHFDHAENAARLAKHFNVPVALHEADMELFESFDKQPLKSWGLVGKVVLDMSLKVLRETTVEKPENIIYVKEGDSLASYGIDGQILELPGHTNGSVGLDVEGKHLLVGDALDNWITAATGHLYYDMSALKRSAARIASLGPRTLYYGHGKPTENKFKLLK
jgi:glyoxylase-like metal-dependent hydrolase (beta-lactamase superfamily II)